MYQAIMQDISDEGSAFQATLLSRLEKEPPSCLYAIFDHWRKAKSVKR